ncbi:MAG: sodium-translocating pyrophosphatase [Thermoprotei archaeon]|jgi:K(+)-stimulated pyrophosphate-energized sodium pump
MNGIDAYILTIPFSVVLALSIAAYLLWYISKQSSGTEKMIRINRAIREGARAYLKRQYKVILAILSLITVAIYLAIDRGIHSGIPYVSLSFFLGTISSIIAGYVSMEAATRSNVKVAEAARKSQSRPLQLAFYGGLVLGLMVVAMSLIGVTGLFYLYWALNGWGNLQRIPELIMGYGFGASLAALFMQLGGGIYTKSADIGADLVGKVEVGIPEDDPRNPAVIADNVGDNVGDCAGRGADLFESISAENIGSMIIGAGLYALTKNAYFIFFPIVARAVGLIATIIGALAVRPKEPTKLVNGGNGSVVLEREKEVLIKPVSSLRNGLVVSTILIAILFYFVITGMLGLAAIYLYFASLAGLAAALLIELVTEYYTGDHKPVKDIAEAAKTGPATTLLMGLSVGMESTALPVIIVIIALGISYIFGTYYAVTIGIPNHTGGIYGTVTATIGMLSLTGIILAIDGYGPIADNAGGIIEMSGVEEEVGKTAEVLDAAGNTTKALAKGFAMGSAVMASLLLFQAYVDVINLASGKEYIINLIQPSVIMGLIIGGMIVFLFASLAIRAVGKTASDIIEEVRRQFREIPGLLEGKAEPQYGKCVDITTKSAQKNMVTPSLIILITPIIVGLLLGPESAGAFLIGVTITGTMLAFFMNTGGAAFDNAKKYLERIGLKRTEQHKAAVVGDTVGDPLKDTAGPSIHIVLKLVNNVAIVMGALFVLYALHLL